MVLELVLLIFPLFLPGFLLVNVFFPGRRSLGGELDILYRVFMGIVLSVAITILYGTLLVLLAGAGQVIFLPETLWPGLALLTLVLFLLGVFRGAYPRIARFLGRTPAPPARQEAEGDDLFSRLEEVSAELEVAEAAEEKETAGIEELRREKRRLEREASRRI
ncbi:MAG: hypothetical protein ACE5KQ_05815 [Thermoplasmata archaeon]